jgi:poly-beta-1,6-N-acetyl-D-glucosamine synthase
VLRNIFNFLSIFIFYYPVVMSLVWIVGSLCFYWRRERKSRRIPPELSSYPLVSVLIPARNESQDIEETVNSVLVNEYPNLEVIVINDASTDNMKIVLDRMMHKHKNLKVLHLEKNMGKANALNLAFAMSHGEVIVTIDADCLLDKWAVKWAVWHFLKFPRVGALTGNPRVRNRTSLLAKIQTAEYSSVIGLIKRTQRIMGKVMTVSGVVAAWRRTAVAHVGLWSNEVITDDIEMTWKMETHFWDVRYEPNVICWMLVPESLMGLWNQRRRWAQGGIEVLRKHCDVLTSWKNRRIWPIYLDYFLGVVWAYSFLLAVILWLINLCFGGNLFYGAMGNPFMEWNGSVVAVICFLQFFVSLLLDRKYDEGLWKVYFWVIWYPVIYWAYNSLATIIAAPKGVFHQMNRAAVWVSPDRGIRK